MNRVDRERRFRQARKVEARIAFLDEPFRETIEATCGICGQRLGWWDRTRPSPTTAASGGPTYEITPDWHTEAYASLPDTEPDEDFRYSYSGYADTGYEVHEVRIDFGPDLRPHRIRSTGGLVSRGGERIGRRRRTIDAIYPVGIARLRTEGQIVTLPANVYCPSCKNTLNAIPVPPPDASAT